MFVKKSVNIFELRPIISGPGPLVPSAPKSIGRAKDILIIGIFENRKKSWLRIDPTIDLRYQTLKFVENYVHGVDSPKSYNPITN